MPSISVLLSTVNENVNVFRMKLNFSEPKISTGGVDVNKWSSLTKAERTRAIDKDWFVYFSFRNPTTGKLKKQPFIKGGVNRLKTKKERLAFFKIIQRNLLLLLEAGFDPNMDNSDLESDFLNGTLVHGTRSTAKTETEEATRTRSKKPTDREDDGDQISVTGIKDAFAMALLINDLT